MWWVGFGELCKCNLQNMRVSRQRGILGATVIEASAIATITGPPAVSRLFRVECGWRHLGLLR